MQLTTLLLQRQFREFQSNLGRQPSLRQEQVVLPDDLDNVDNKTIKDVGIAPWKDLNKEKRK